MQDEMALPIVGAAKWHSFAPCFAFLKEIMNYPHLNEEEKYLWIWLICQSAHNPSFSCSFTYEQIATTMNKSPQLIHRNLFRLVITGFISADLPIWYGALTSEMVKALRHIKLVLPPLKPLREE